MQVREDEGQSGEWECLFIHDLIVVEAEPIEHQKQVGLGTHVGPHHPRAVQLLHLILCGYIYAELGTRGI